MKRLGRNSKYDQAVEEVELLHCNPDYAFVRLRNGNEETVALRHLAPGTSIDENTDHLELPIEIEVDTPNNEHITSTDDTETCELTNDHSNSPNPLHENIIQSQQRTRPYFLRNREA
jgi:hypothetical protein